MRLQFDHAYTDPRTIPQAPTQGVLEPQVTEVQPIARAMYLVGHEGGDGEDVLE